MSERVCLTGAAQTLLMTLWMRAQDARSARPVLGDAYAQETLDAIAFDADELWRLRGNIPLIAGRAKAIDDRVRGWLSTRPDAVVVHLGCGLDARAARLHPLPSVDWIELDQPDVIDLRERLLPAREGVRTIAADVTAVDWWSELPDGRPTLVLGEGLLMYLPPTAVRALLGAALARPGEVTLLFDTVAPWVRRVAGLTHDMRRAGTGFQSTTADADAALAGIPLADDVSLVYVARRASTGALARTIGLVGRDAMRLRMHFRAAA